jgi:hypothetical protein
MCPPTAVDYVVPFRADKVSHLPGGGTVFSLLGQQRQAAQAGSVSTNYGRSRTSQMVAGSLCYVFTFPRQERRSHKKWE